MNHKYVEIMEFLNSWEDRNVLFFSVVQMAM